jgi:hypothetical protein
MADHVLFDAACLLDTWSMAKRAVASAAGIPVAEKTSALEAELRRGTCPGAVRQMLWTMADERAIQFRLASLKTQCIDRRDSLGRSARMLLRQHLADSDYVVVVSDLPRWFDDGLIEHLRAHHVLSSQDHVELLIGAPATCAVKEFLHSSSVSLSCCIGYASPPNSDLFRFLGRSRTIDYSGVVHNSWRACSPAGNTQAPARRWRSGVSGPGR